MSHSGSHTPTHNPAISNIIIQSTTSRRQNLDEIPSERHFEDHGRPQVRPPSLERQIAKSGTRRRGTAPQNSMEGPMVRESPQTQGRADHRSNSSSDSYAVCPQCDNRQFTNKKALLQHTKSPSVCHPRCSICNRRFVNETAFNAHMAVNHSPTYDCMVCVRTSNTPFALEDHYCGSQAQPKCDRCERGFKDAPACEEHQGTSHPENPCLLCGRRAFHGNAVDQRHWVTGNHLSCNLCDVDDDTTYHQHVSATHAKLHCGACCNHFETEKSVQTHLTLPTVHPKCNNCVKYDNVRNAPREHMHSPMLPLSSTQKDHITTDEQNGVPGSTSASGANTSGNMFSSGSYFAGGSYYKVQGNVNFSPPPSQIPHGLMILYQNISTSACHDSRERFPPPRCHPSTRKEIFDAIMEHIMQTPPSFKVLYLFGSEGTGKSAIAQTIAEYSKLNGTLGACFFFSRASHERNTDKNLIATLAYQLCVNIPGLKRFIVKAVEDDLSTFQKDVGTQIERLIINPIVQAKNEGVVHGYPILIVIDGIDECECMKEQRAFLTAISGAMARHNLPPYFVITSRPETHIINWLNQDPTICSTSHRLDLDQNHTHTKRDIEVHVRSEFERIRSVHHIPESALWPSQASIQTLVSGANMSFRYASEIMASIDDQNDTPQNRLEDILRTLTQSSSGGDS